MTFGARAVYLRWEGTNCRPSPATGGKIWSVLKSQMYYKERVLLY